MCSQQEKISKNILEPFLKLKTNSISISSNRENTDKIAFDNLGLKSKSNRFHPYQKKKIPFEQEEKKREQDKDSFDMFCESPIPELINLKPLDKNKDDMDSVDGYFQPDISQQIIDNLNKKTYTIKSFFGRGVYSCVVEAEENLIENYDAVEQPNVVAIKILRGNDSFKRSGKKEASFLKKLCENTTTNNNYIIGYKTHFIYCNHFCLVQEAAGMTLRKLLTSFGKDIGISLEAVRKYSRQLFIALEWLKKYNIVHADIKLDNVLLSKDNSSIKLADFGCSFSPNENFDKGYLCAPFYRCPEIITDNCNAENFSFPIDMWSVGCTLYELFTSNFLLTGRNNNELLFQILQITNSNGSTYSFSKKKTIPLYFDQHGNFKLQQFDNLSQKYNAKTIRDIPPRKILLELLENSTKEEFYHITQFSNLLEKIMVLDPKKRITSSQAFDHPFLNESSLTQT